MSILMKCQMKKNRNKEETDVTHITGRNHNVNDKLERETIVNPPKDKKRKEPGMSKKLTAHFRVLPDFVILGAQRTGTTSLYFNMRRHPNITPPTRKEIHWFGKKIFKGELWYRSHFPLVTTKFFSQRILKREWITGEASPYYLFHPPTPERLHRILPSAKLIVLLRNPANRAYSHYCMKIRSGTETLSFEEAIKAEPERLKGTMEKMKAKPNETPFEHMKFSYMARSVYADQLSAWFRFFPREQILILKSEDLYENTDDVLQQVFSFLGLPEYRTPVIEEHHRMQYPPMSEKTKNWLSEYFRPHNERLYKMLDRDFGWD